MDIKPKEHNQLIANALEATGRYKIDRVGLFGVDFQDSRNERNFSTYLVVPGQTHEQDLLNTIGLAELHNESVVPIFYKDGEKFFKLSVQNKVIPNQLKHLSHRDVFRMIDLNPLEKKVLDESGEVSDAKQLVYFQPKTETLKEGVVVFRMETYKDDSEILKLRRITSKLKQQEGQSLAVKPFKLGTATFVYR